MRKMKNNNINATNYNFDLEPLTLEQLTHDEILKRICSVLNFIRRTRSGSFLAKAISSARELQLDTDYREGKYILKISRWDRVNIKFDLVFKISVYQDGNDVAVDFNMDENENYFSIRKKDGEFDRIDGIFYPGLNRVLVWIKDLKNINKKYDLLQLNERISYMLKLESASLTLKIPSWMFMYNMLDYLYEQHKLNYIFDKVDVHQCVEIDPATAIEDMNDMILNFHDCIKIQDIHLNKSVNDICKLGLFCFINHRLEDVVSDGIIDTGYYCCRPVVVIKDSYIRFTNLDKGNLMFTVVTDENLESGTFSVTINLLDKLGINDEIKILHIQINNIPMDIAKIRSIGYLVNLKYLGCMMQSR